MDTPGRPARPATTPALRLTAYVGENDAWHHRPLYGEIVHRAHAAGLAGASVFRGIEGFAGAGLVHTTRLLSLGEDLPVAVVIVDAEDRIHAFLPTLAELTGIGLVTLEACEIVRFGGPTGEPKSVEQGGRGSGE